MPVKNSIFQRQFSVFLNFDMIGTLLLQTIGMNFSLSHRWHDKYVVKYEAG